MLESRVSTFGAQYDSYLTLYLPSILSLALQKSGHLMYVMSGLKDSRKIFFSSAGNMFPTLQPPNTGALILVSDIHFLFRLEHVLGIYDLMSVAFITYRVGYF